MTTLEGNHGPIGEDRVWADHRIEAWLDGELGSADADRFARLLTDDEWLQTETGVATLVSETLTNIPMRHALMR